MFGFVSLCLPSTGHFLHIHMPVCQFGACSVHSWPNQPDTVASKGLVRSSSRRLARSDLLRHLQMMMERPQFLVQNWELLPVLDIIFVLGSRVKRHPWCCEQHVKLHTWCDDAHAVCRISAARQCSFRAMSDDDTIMCLNAWKTWPEHCCQCILSLVTLVNWLTCGRI